MGAKTCILFITIHLVYAVTAQDNLLKRVPHGFVGMRGKKTLDSEPNENELHKRKPQFFVGVKGKKSYEEILDTDFEKRVPMGFVGMRGKKESLYPEVLYPAYDYGTRTGSLIGQIDYATDDNNAFEYPLTDDAINEFLEKLRENYETPEAGPDEGEMTNEVEKRAKMHQFFGVRGKKSIPAKRAYDVTFRGKFIGVRGKKDWKNSGAQEVRPLLNGPWSKRRGQKGFVGMRGKKWTEDDVNDTNEEIMPN